MFKYHGYSCDCPKPPLKKVELDPAGVPKLELTRFESLALDVLNTIKAADGTVINLPDGIRMRLDIVLMFATVRRVGVQ